MKINRIILLFCIIIPFAGSAQIERERDSLMLKDEDYILRKLDSFYSIDNSKAAMYADAYLNKAKKVLDSFKIVEAYYFLSDLNSYEESLKYLDSAITYNKSMPKNGFHSLLYIQRSNLHYDKGKYRAAIDSYIEAKKNTDPEKQQYWFITIEYNLGLMKLRVGDYKEALENFKEAYEYILKNDIKTEYPDHYVISLAALASSYQYNNKLDSAVFYNNLEIKEAKSLNNNKYYIKGRLTQAIINFDKGDYKNCLDSIIKYEPLIKEVRDSLDLATLYLYKGKSYKKLNDIENALKQFKKVDTLVQKNKKYVLQIRENYEILYRHYKQNNDLENHLLYLEKLTNFDSILYSNNTYVKNTLLTEYEIPKLIKEKETLIAKLVTNDHKKLNILYILSVVIGILLLLTFYYYRKRSIYKKRFEKLIQQKSTPKTKKTKITTKIGLPDALVKSVLEKLHTFEKEKGFLNNDVTLSSMAKQVATNTSYLSKIINAHKGKNFSAYLTELRINYAVEALKKQPKLRAYTIKAIAFDVGFKNAESFTLAFHKQTKIYPSYFIKQLEKEQNIV